MSRIRLHPQAETAPGRWPDRARGARRSRRSAWTIGLSALLHAILLGVLFIIPKRDDGEAAAPPSYELMFEGSPTTPPTVPGLPPESAAPSTDRPTPAPTPNPAPPSPPQDALPGPQSQPNEMPTPDAPVAPPVPDKPAPPVPDKPAPPVPDTPPPPKPQPPAAAPAAPQALPLPPAPPPPTEAPVLSAPPSDAAVTPEPAPLPPPARPPPVRAPSVPEVRLEPPPPPPPQPSLPDVPIPTPPIPPPPAPPAPRAPQRPRTAPPPGTLGNPMDLSFNSAPSRQAAPRATAPRGSIASRSLDLSPGAPKGPNRSEMFFDARAGKLGADWKDGLMGYWLNHRYYPRQASENGEDGSVDIELTVNGSGKVQNAVLKSRSGSPFIDMAAVGTWRNAQLRPLPPELGNSYTFTITLNYILIR